MKLQEAIEQNLLVIYRQAIRRIDEQLDTPSDHFEILLRIREGGTLRSPKAFLDALTTEQHRRLDGWVFSEVCRLPSQFRYSVNLSADSLEDVSLVKTLSDITTHWLTLEITEGHDYSPVALLSIRYLQQFFPIVMDDMGAGYSSLVNLDAISFDGIKIDGQIVQKICTHKKSRAMVGGIMAIAQELDLTCVAEWVESIEILQMLKTLHSNYAPGLRLQVQGYAIGCPELAEAEFISSPGFCNTLSQPINSSLSASSGNP